MEFSENDIPDLTGKIVIVTGGNSGIGKQMVTVLAGKGAKVYLGARSHAKYDETVKEIHESRPNTLDSQIEFLEVDLSSAAGAKSAAENFKSKEKELHILFNNAGIMGTKPGTLSEEDYEMQWAVNVFAPFVFTFNLLTLLQDTAQGLTAGTVRIVNTTSDGASAAAKSGIPLDDPMVGRDSSRFQAYGQSKVGVILLTRQLARRYPAILSLGPHPGHIQSNLTRELEIPSPVMWILNRTVFKAVEYGALTPLFAGTGSISMGRNGSFLIPLAKFESKPPHPQCSDDEFGEKIWEWNMAAMRKSGTD